MDLTNLCILLAHLIAFTIIFKVLKSQLKHHHNATTLPPSPPALPILGHLHLFNLTKGALFLHLQKLSEQYGHILFLRLGTQRLLLLSSAASVEQCFSQNDVVFANRPDILTYQIKAYNSTTVGSAPYGDHWRNLRRIAAINMFSSACVHRTANVRNTQVRRMIKNLTHLSDPTGEKVKINLNTLFSKLALSVAGVMTIGKSCEDIGNVFYQSGLYTMCDFVPFLRWIGYKGFEKTLIESNRKRDGFLQGVLDEFRQKNRGVSLERKTGSGDKPVLESLMCLQAVEPDVYTDDTIKGLLALMFTAGFHTSIKTMEWGMVALMNHPKILAKAREEIDTLIKPGHLIDDSDVPNLPYLRCIINEILRVFPISPTLQPHCSSTDCIVNGYYVPKKTILLINSWAVHHDPALWDEPYEFRPERFEGFEGERDGYRFIPFGVGRRRCPAVALGFRLIALALGVLIQCFEWEMVGNGAEIFDQGRDGVGVPKGKSTEAKYAVRVSMSDFLSQL